MLNHNGDVVPVAADFVIDKMMDGYRFFEGEPLTPHRSGDPDRPEGNPLRPIGPSKYDNRIEAMRYWGMALHKETIKYEDRNDLVFDWSLTVQTMIVAATNAAQQQGNGLAAGSFGQGRTLNL